MNSPQNGIGPAKSLADPRDTAHATILSTSMRTPSSLRPRPSASGATVFSWFWAFALLIPTPASATLRLTEIMYHPLPLSETDETESGEFIEFHNTGLESISLEGYQIDRGITFQFPAQAVIPAKGYIVVAKTREAVPASLPNNRVFVGYDGNLSNAGETIRLVNSEGDTVISFRYGSTGDWPAAADGTGHSLSLASLTENPRSARAWIPSLKRHGSPGGPERPASDTAQTSRELIKKGTVGRYFKGTKEPSGGTTAWTQPDFTTNADWLTGRSGFGYSSEAAELLPVTTRLTDMRGNYLSFYVRIPFELAPEELRRFQQLTLRMHYDDSYVIYLNGTRVASAGVNGNPPAFDQTSIAGNDYAPDTINMTRHRELLNPGQNLLAIQGHNIGLNNSSDFVLGPELSLRISPDPSPTELLKAIVINEIQTNHNSQPDFVEFYNPTDSILDLSGLWLSDKSENLGLYQLPAQTTIAPGAHLPIPLSAESTGFAISSLGDQIFLSSEDLSEVIAAYAFGALPLNTSIGRYPDGASDWFSSSEPSPGMPNSRLSTPAVFITELMYHDATSQRREYVEIRNHGENPIDISGWELNGVQFRFPTDTILEPEKSYLIADDAETLIDTYPFVAGTILGEFRGSLSNRGERISLLNKNDIVVDTVKYDDRFPWPITPDGIGSSLERLCFDAPFDSPSAWSASPLLQPSPGKRNNIESCESQRPSSIRISEILYHPATDTIDDRIPEFIELTNIGSSSVSLSGWVLAGDIFYVFPTEAGIPPGEALVVAWDPTGFRALAETDLGVIQGPYQGELPNGGGEILLVKQDGRLADQARYNDDFPWPSLADGGIEGRDISLKRRCLRETGDLPSNWIASQKPTPGSVSPPLLDCLSPSAVLNTGTIPNLVTRQTRPVVYAEFTGAPNQQVFLDYWVDDPETTGESSKRIAMNNQGMGGDQTADDLIWSVELPALPNNSIVRYKIVYGDEQQGLSSPHPDRDAFAWHAYFVDPQTDSNLPNNYHLFISSTNWRTLHQATSPGRVTRGRANPRWNDEVPAVFVANGVVHDVSVRHQGSRWNRKNGSTISFDCESHQSGSAQVRSWRIDFPSHRKHNGMDVIILQKQSGWPQHISFKMFELAGVPAPRTSWANLRINGCNYNNDAFQIERPGRDLVARWFGEVGDLFKSQ